MMIEPASEIWKNPYKPIKGLLGRQRHTSGLKSIGMYLHANRFMQPSLEKLLAKRLCIDSVKYLKRLISQSTPCDKTALETFYKEEERIDRLYEEHMGDAWSVRTFNILNDRIGTERELTPDKKYLVFAFTHANESKSNIVGIIKIKPFYASHVDLSIRHAFLQQMPPAQDLVSDITLDR